MPVDPSFARPALLLGTDPVLGPVAVAGSPSGGQGLALQPDGTIPPALLSSSSELDYVQITAPQTISATTEGAATVVITGTALVWDGATAALFEFFSPRVAADGTAIQIILWDDTNAVSLGLWDNGSSTTRTPHLAYRYRPPATATAHSVRAFRTGGTTAGTTVGAGAAAAGNRMPAYLRITSV